MNNVHSEYNRDTNPYPSFGKKYNDEKAIISLTSWRARINTVSKTLFSLLKQCPGFHIVLVLSEEEFPKMMDELPENLKLFVYNELIEVLWVYKNYKSFKKVLFTMDKYRDVPIISADDDCIYTCNYAQILFDEYVKTEFRFPIIFRKNSMQYMQGPCSLYPPYIFSSLIKNFNYDIINVEGDDDYYSKFFIKNKIKIHMTEYMKYPCFFANEICPLHGSKNHPDWIKLSSIY